MLDQVLVAWSAGLRWISTQEFDVKAGRSAFLDEALTQLAAVSRDLLSS